MVNKELPKLREKLRAAIVEYESSVGLNLKVCYIWMCVLVCMACSKYVIDLLNVQKYQGMLHM